MRRVCRNFHRAADAVPRARFRPETVFRPDCSFALDARQNERAQAFGIVRSDVGADVVLVRAVAIRIAAEAGDLAHASQLDVAVGVHGRELFDQTGIATLGDRPE